MTEIRDNNTNQDLKIPISSGNDSVAQIDMSTETGVTYVKIADRNGISRLWKINSFVGAQRMRNTVTGNIGRILCLKTSGNLLYEDSGNGRVYQYNTASSLRINGTRNLKMLGIDNADNVYLAAMNNGRTDTVYYGSVSAGSWNTDSLSKAVDPAGIYVTCSGEIYLNDSVKSSISKLSAYGQSLQTGNTTPKSLSKSEFASSSVGQPGIDTYKGTLFDAFDSGFLSIENGCVVHNEFS